MTRSVSELIQKIQAGNSFAEKEVWVRFIDRLIEAARKHLRFMPRRAVDEEDVALVAFDAFLRGAREGRFKQLESRDDLWAVLAMLAERTSISVLRRDFADKRGGGQVRGESVFDKILCESSMEAGLHQFQDPAPHAVEVFTIEVRELLDQLGDEMLKRVALLRLEGFSNAEIAQKQGISLRAVERKLQLIRARWDKCQNSK